MFLPYVFLQRIPDNVGWTLGRAFECCARTAIYPELGAQCT